MNTVADRYKSFLISIWAVNLKGKASFLISIWAVNLKDKPSFLISIWAVNLRVGTHL